MSHHIVKINFIGFGNMAKAIAKSLSVHAGYQLRAASPSLNAGMNAEGILTHPDNLAHLADADIIILSVKPKKMQEVLVQIRDFIPEHGLILSVAAGLNLKWLGEHTSKHQAIIRSMPNIACTVMKGATPLIANSFVSQKQKDDVTQLFACSGVIAWLEHEKDIDVYTALSGSGPAYFFLFLEEMAKAGEKLGLSHELAKKFTLQTMAGAALLAEDHQIPFNELRKKVTSPKGTTAAAIEVFQDQHLGHIIFNAIEAAYCRAKALGEESVN